MTERTKRAREWKKFRRAHLFTQERLAQVLGISKRTVQHIEMRHVDASISTLSKFEALKAKYQQEKSFWNEVHHGREGLESPA